MSVFSAKRQVSRPRATAAAKKSQTLDPAIALATRKEAESLLKTERSVLQVVLTKTRGEAKACYPSFHHYMNAFSTGLVQIKLLVPETAE